MPKSIQERKAELEAEFWCCSRKSDGRKYRTRANNQRIIRNQLNKKGR